jgi:hypothetical protein
MEALLVWLISVVHAGIHLLGWSFSFPTHTEALIWRSCSLTLLVVMVLGGAVPVLSTRSWFDFSFNMLWIWIREARRKTWVRVWRFDLIVDFAYAAYIIARLLIFVEIFVCFRSLPTDVYDDVTGLLFCRIFSCGKRGISL